MQGARRAVMVQCGDINGFMMLLCSASAAIRKRSISAWESCFDGLDLAIGKLRFRGFAATGRIIFPFFE